MMLKAIRVFAVIPAAALLIGGALQASTLKSEKIEIPFAFSVEHSTMLPPGEYQVQQQSGSQFAALVNVKTGQSVQVLRPSNTHKEGKARLLFENTAQGHSLKSIS